MKFNYLLLFTFFVTIKIVISSRILCLFPAPAASHLIIDTAIANGLADRGHNVTVITAIPFKFNDNYKFEHILIDLPEHQKEFTNIVQTLKSTSGLRMLMISFELAKYFIDYSSALVVDKRMQNILSEREYDLVVLGYFFNNIHFGIGAHFKCPNVVLWVNQPLTKINDLVGNPSDISYIPLLSAELTQPMNFLDRLKNSAHYLIQKLADKYSYYKDREYYSKLFPSHKNYPNFDEILKNVSLVLTASHFSDMIIRPNVPNLIEIGGVQIKGNPKALPEKHKNFLDNAKDGAILFSLGTNAKSSELDAIVMEQIFKTLSKLPQKIIWKWETDNVPGHAENILYEKWLPQDDILSHPNIRAFISHGGLGGLAEAKHHGVPIIGIPLFGDQPTNLEAIRLAGWAIVLNLKEFTEEKFSTAVQNILYKPQYRDTVQRISRIYKDRPTSAMETAMFWIEYILRHNGAAHLQSPAIHMSAFSYYSVDVFLFYCLIIYLIYIIFKILVKFIIGIIKFIVKFIKNKLKIKKN